MIYPRLLHHEFLSDPGSCHPSNDTNPNWWFLIHPLRRPVRKTRHGSNVECYCWWLKSGDHHLGSIKPCKWWDFNYQPQLVIAGFQPVGMAKPQAILLLDSRGDHVALFFKHTCYSLVIGNSIKKLWNKPMLSGGWLMLRNLCYVCFVIKEWWRLTMMRKWWWWWWWSMVAMMTIIMAYGDIWFIWYNIMDLYEIMTPKSPTRPCIV